MKFSATLIILCVFIQLKSIAQETTKNETTKVIQFTGVVLNADSVYIPGVHIYTPVYGRGTSTNVYGFFSMPALEGDSLIISAVGYKKSFYKIPEIKGQTLRAIISLEVDTTELKEVMVYNLPPTAQAFKQAVLAMRLPDEYNNINENLSPKIMQELLKNLPADGSSNHQWFIQQQANYQRTRYSYPVNPLLNPMAWVELFRSIKRGDFKNDD
jgi:hypothetical protein